MMRYFLIFGFILSAVLFFTEEKSKSPGRVLSPPAVKQEIKIAPASDIKFAPVSFSDLKGWDKDDFLQALEAVKLSCSAALSRRQKEWKKFCSDLNKRHFKTNKELRDFLAAELKPYAVNPSRPGLFTGYYEPEIEGSLIKTAEYYTPLYAMPKDILKINLGRFDPKYKGDVVFGRMEGSEIKPYLTRKEIEQNQKIFPAEVILWVKHPSEAFVLQIQGSGLIRLPDGETVSVGYAGNNGHKFIGIGALMAERGLLKPGVYTMPEIMGWLKANSVQAEELMHQNPRYIFFRKLKDRGAVGSLNVRLTARRSLAVDPGYIPLGSLLWLETTAPDGKPMDRLMTAQDTGSAIKGPVRGDFFWGTGDKALQEAGRMKSKGTYFILMPKDLTPDTALKVN